MAATDRQPPGKAAQDQAAGFIDGMLGMYRQGWFPMADPDNGRIDWYQPRQRGVIPLEASEFKVSRTLAQRVRSGRFEIRADTAFREVITACAQPRASDGQSWIDERIIEAYCLLHRAGHTHSVEAWWRAGDTQEVLVGGLYGLHIGGVFFGESMFSRPELGGTDSSKVCLVHLVHHMRRQGMVLLDAQMWNKHLSQFGCKEVAHRSFLGRLAKALAVKSEWGRFVPEETVRELKG